MTSSPTVKLGNLDLSPCVKDIRITQDPSDVMQYECTITLDLSKLKDFQYGNLRETITVVDGNVMRFSGVVVETISTNDFYVLSCKDNAQHLKEIRVAGQDAFDGFTPQEIVYHIVSSTSIIRPGMIQGLNLNTSSREFLVSVPIFGLELSKPCRISSVDFCKLEPTTEDMRWISEKAKEDWGQANVIATVKVKTTGFFEATEAGREAITKAIDLMSYAAKLSILGYPTLKGLQPTQWQRTQLLSRIRPGQETYLRDLTATPAKRWLRSGLTTETVAESISQNALPELTSATFVDPIDDRSRTLSLALRWLRLGNQEPDPTDRLLDLWIALEFIVSREKVQPTLSSAGFEDLKAAVMMSKIRGENGVPLNGEGKAKEELWLKIQSKINQVDLRAQFETFCTKHAIVVTDSEREVIWGKNGARTQRNDLEHGRAVGVNKEQLSTMEHIVSKMILGLLR